MTASLNASTTSGVVLTSDTSGNLALQSNGTTVATAQSTGLSINTYTPATSLITSGTAQATTSGTSVTFTSIPSWVKKITVMFFGVSTTGTANYQIQIGSGSYTTSGYSSGASNGSALVNSTTAFLLSSAVSAAQTYSGHVVLTLVSGNNWVQSGTLGSTGANYTNVSGGSVTISGALDRVQLTTANGTDTFDAGSINIQYE